MATVRRREPPKTWSLLGDLRRKPSEYEVVTAKLHYHYRREPAPFELDPNAPINTWYLRYREGSPLQADTWEDFRDPHQLTYQVYVQRQAERESYMENLVDEFELRNHDARLQTEWVRVLDRLYLPARFPMHALQMSALYEAQVAPSSFITNAAYFQAADEQRRIQWLAYRAKSLSLEHDAELASSAHARRRWEDDAVWQPLRETVEKMLIAYDWGEAFVALNLMVKPVFDEVFNVQLAELARAHEDALLALMLDDFALDIQRSRDWSVALVQYATAQHPANTELFKQWIEQWKPLAYRGIEGVVELFGQAPRPVEPKAVSAKVRAAHHAFLARCGLNAVQPDSRVKNLGGDAKTTVDIIGDMATWGTHFCLFYETKEDLRDALISYCKSGLEKDEFCLWVVGEPLTIEEATAALKEAVPNLDSYLADSRIEIVSTSDFFLQGGKFDRKRVTDALFAKLASVSRKGYAGVRLTGDTSWVTKKDWIPFCELEEGINEVIGNFRLAVLCAYSLASCGAYEILDAVRTHQFAIARRQGSWVVIETAALTRAKAEIKRLNEDLEERVLERTSELMKASEALREAQAELGRVTRLTAMGELTASIAHEIRQPIFAAATDAETCLRWLTRDQPEVAEAQEAASRLVKDVSRASDIINRIVLLFKKDVPRRELADVNGVIQETIALLRSEASRYSISIHAELTEGLPNIMADRVALQQVLMNLMLNAIEAMKDMSPPGKLTITTRQDENRQLLISVTDTGVGLPPGHAEQIFTAFFTSKPQGTGMGLPISRSIVESHGGRLWATSNSGPGATFQFALPLEAAARQSA
jgi:signal transduction histidine kinase